MGQLPLLGLRVLDLTRVLAGPLATMRLGDLGADVIKVERPGSGDESRGWGPPFDARGESAYFLCCNRNKLSLAADFAAPADVALVHELAAGADVVVDNYLPGALARRGLDPDEIVARHPRLIWITITGFGAQSERPGYDFAVQAEAGWLAVTGEPSGEPMKTGVALADIVTGKDTLIAVLATLAGVRAGLDVDRHVTVSLFHSAAESLINVAQNVMVGGRDAPRMGNAHANLVPYQLFHAADAPFVLAVGNDAQFAAVVRVVGASALADARFATNRGRVTHRDELVPLLAAPLATRSAEQWVERFLAEGVPAGLVRSVRDVVEAVGGSPLTGIPPLAPGTVRRPPPRLDEHGGLIRRKRWDAFAEA